MGKRWYVAGAITIMAALLAILLAGCSAGQARPTATSTSAPQTLILPSILQGQHVFVTDLVTGDLAELGGATTRVWACAAAAKSATAAMAHAAVVRT